MVGLTLTNIDRPWVDLDFVFSLSLPISAWADGKLEEKAEKVGKETCWHTLSTCKRM